MRYWDFHMRKSGSAIFLALPNHLVVQVTPPVDRKNRLMDEKFPIMHVLFASHSNILPTIEEPSRLLKHPSDATQDAVASSYSPFV